MADAWFVYLARCADGTLYCGIARDVAARIAEHDAGKGAKYTRGRGPLALLAKRRCPTKSDALRLELAVKRLPKEEKLAMLSRRAERDSPKATRGKAPTQSVGGGRRPRKKQISKS